METVGRPQVSVVVPTLNPGDRLTRLLEAVKAQSIAGELELIVIDSGSRDGTADRARRSGARVMSVPRHQFSHGRTRNQAIRASRGEFVVLTVQDALPSDDRWLARLIAPMLEQPKVAGTYGLQVAPETSSLLVRTRSSLWSEANARPVLRSLKTPSEYQEMSPQERLQLIRFDNVTSCIRRRVWEALPLPERSYGEDMAWAKSVLRAGYKTAYTPEARVWHSHERGPIYELRRAYVDGYARVQLVDWPAPCLELGEVVEILRRMTFFLLTKRFDTLVDPEAARRFLLAEMHHYGRLVAHRPVRIYMSALDFSMSLTNRAIRLCPEGVLPPRVWIDLFRFAIVGTVGQNLGADAATRTNRSRLTEKVAWHTLHWFLGRSM